MNAASRRSTRPSGGRPALAADGTTTSPTGRRVLRLGWVSLAGAALIACNYRHSAPVEASPLPPPPGERVMHSSPLLVEVTSDTHDSQCIAYDGYRTLCFHGVRSALEKATVEGLWPAFPGVRAGRSTDANPGDYVLQVQAHLEALPPDEAGPGWSAGVQGRWRLLRDGRVLAEEALASRSRASFPYGAALGEGGSEVIDALGAYLGMAVARVDEERPIPPRPLPAVVTRSLGPATGTPESPSTQGAETAKTEDGRVSTKNEHRTPARAALQAKER